MVRSIFLAVVLVLLFEVSKAHRLVATKVGNCFKWRAYGIIRMRKFQCSAMGGAWNGSPSHYDWINCHLDWCQISTSGAVARGKVWAVCEYDNQYPGFDRTYGIVRMQRFQCDQINGKYNGNPTYYDWIDCHLYWCSFSGWDQHSIDGIVPASVGECVGPKVGYGIIRMKHRECSVLRGRWNGNPGAWDWMNCHLDWCFVINCVPRDGWKDIQTCSNPSSKTSYNCKVTFSVGTTKTHGTSRTSGGSVSATYEQNLGITLAGIFSASAKVGITTGYHWSQTTSSNIAFAKSTQRSLSVTVPPKTSVKFQQVVGYCGNYKVNVLHYRLVDV